MLPSSTETAKLAATTPTAEEPPKKKRKGPKGPNPLSVKKKKPKQPEPAPKSAAKQDAERATNLGGKRKRVDEEQISLNPDAATSQGAKRKRRRKGASTAIGGDSALETGD